MLTRIGQAFSPVLFLFAVQAAPLPPTYYHDIQPLIQAHCQSCHRPGEVAPMSLGSYKEVRPWANSIKEAVLLKKMPPWLADPHFGKFANDRSLSPQQIDLIRSWVDAGAPEGDPKDAHSGPKFIEGWNIPQPDAVLQMPQPFKVPADGKVDYQYIVLPTKFTEDKWVQMAETRPTNRAVVHHMVVFIRTPDSKWLRDAKPGIPFQPPPENLENISGGDSEILTIYTPGIVPDVYQPGQAKLIKAGSDLILQAHYTPNGKDAEDATRIGLVFAKEPPTERIRTISAAPTDFVIPPGDPDYPVVGNIRFRGPARIVSFFPHMHLRGRDFEYRAIYPNGETATLLKVPHYDFNWQLAYKPAGDLEIPAGTRIECTAHFDNSPNNPNNPDPKASVRFGEQSWEEMAIGFLDIAQPVHRP
ncbi:MAG: cytochrome c [Acidobacteriota bacterium]|nr:cytochrome c [Acidobacteriota bacterium]